MILSVGALIEKDGRFWLGKARKWRGLYTLPGGKVEKGEHVKDAVVREVWEELSIEIIPKYAVTAFHYRGEGNYYKNVEMFVVVFYCLYKGGIVSHNDEFYGGGWFSLYELKKMEDKIETYSFKSLLAFERGDRFEVF